MRIYWIVAVIMCLMVATACGPSIGEQIRQQAEKAAVSVNLPKSMTNSEDAPDIKDDASKVVSVMRGSFYVGRNEYPIDALGDVLKKRLAEAPNAPVYLQGDAVQDYDYVVSALDVIRRAGGEHVALLVFSDDKGPMRRLMVSIPPEPKDEAATPPAKVLEVSITKDDKLSINGKDAGTAEQPDKFVEVVKAAPGMPVTIKGRHTARYVDVVRLVNAAKGAGATSISLAIDDLP